ncbi:MAG TPA: TonB family protein [Opitutaceae bacterium]|jgi:protein TonB|nr:TonB family protein [Opitutaceae bacterium]
MNTTSLDGGVKRQFALPVAIVLGAHAALFLGLVKAHPLLLPQLTPVVTEAPAQPIVLPLSDIVAELKSDPAGGGSAQAQLPEMPNPTSPDQPDRQEISMTPISPRIPVVSPIIGPWQPGGPGKLTGSGGQTMTADSLDRPPQALAQPQPIYPFDARSKELNGQVVVEFLVDKSGQVMNPRVVSSSDPIFEETTLRAIENWRFAPGTWHGVPVRFSMRVPVAFRCNG